MNEIRMYLKTSGSIAELYKDFNLFKGSYQNVLLSIYVPKSLLYENQEGTFSNVVKTGAILASQNGTKITTKSYYADYVKDIEINGIAYSVYSQHLPHEYVVYAGTQTVIANVVALDITDPNTPVVLQITTSQTAQLVIQESAYLADDDIIDPTDLEKINAQLDELQKNKLDKQTGVSSYPQVYAVEGNNQKLIPVSNGSTIAPNDRIAQYTSYGTLFTQPPETDSDTTNKGYVDGEIKKSNDEQMVINERIVEILDGIEIVKVNDLEYNLMVDETIKGTINIPKDQFLKSVSYDPETHVLTFIFLTSDGEVPTPIDMSSLVDVYQAGNGLTLANNTFSIKLDPSSNNALTLSAAGLMLDNTPLEKAAEDIEILNSDIPKSAKETGAFISGDNTLAGAKAEVSVESKNLLELKLIDVVSNGITYTQNSDGSITVNGTATDRSYAYIINYNTPIKPGIYTLSGCPSGGQSTTYRLALSLYIDGVWQTNETDYGDSVTFEVALPINQMTAYIEIMSGTTVENLTFYPQLEYGETATPYTPYLPTGTVAEVQACGKNLFDITKLKPPTTIDSLGGLSNIIQVTNGEMINPRPLYSNSAYINIPINLIKGTYTISGECWIDLNDPQGNIVYIGMWDGQKAGGSINTTITPGQWTKVQYTYIVEDLHAFTLQFQQEGNTASDTCTLKVRNIQLEYGDKATFYAPYEGLTYPATVGQTIEVKQYDRITNIFSNTTGGAVSTQFLQSTRYELDTKPVSLAGTYAERPTGTYPYVVLYTATDTGRTYRLERNTDGSVSGNWVNISSAGGTGGGFTPRGEWNSATTYNENDLVSLNGSSYICIEENTNATPASNPDKWMVNAEKGATGATGATGTTGPAGTDGHSVYTATDTCSAEVGVECEVYKDSTNAKGVGDVIINASGRVFTVTGEDVYEGKPTWAGPVTAIINGPQGPAGANGTNGKDYLIYIGDTLTGTSGPNNYSGIIPVDDFNRVPATDEYFTALYKQTLTSGSQLSYCLLQVATASDSGALCQVTKAELLNAPKYIHHIRYTNGSDIVYFTYINDSSDNYTATNDMYLLTTELANKQLDVKERSLMANGIVGGKTIIAVYGEADGVIWGVPTSGEDVAFTKANCKIDDLTIKL